MITISIDELREMFEDAGKVAVAAFIREQTPAKDRISQRKAYEMFGESRVKGWVRSQKICPLRDGTTKNSTRHYSIAEMQTLAASEKALFTIIRRRRAV